MKNKIIPTMVTLSVLLGFGFATHSYAASFQQQMGQGQMGEQAPDGFGEQQGQRGNSVMGSVSSIDGEILTVESRGMGEGSATTTYTVDVSSATVEKNRASSTLSSIVTGDFVMIEGTISDTSITATRISIENMQNRNGKNLDNKIASSSKKISGKIATSTKSKFEKMASSSKDMKRPSDASSTNDMINGDGQPVIGGTISAISGTTITLANKSGTSYTIDASSATVTKNNESISVSSMAIGDSVLIQGTINGTSVTATSIIDKGTATSSDKTQDSSAKSKGFWQGIGSFFSKMFGF